VSLIGTGWKAKGWYEDSKDLHTTKAVEKLEKSVATKLEERLASLKANERTVEREKLKIVERPVYRNVCLDDSGVRLANAAKNGGNTSQPSSEVR